MTEQVLRVGTRGSALALAQSGAIADSIVENSGVGIELVRVKTEGDVNAGPLATIGGTGIFVTAVRSALLDGRVDVIVHSFKDLPTAAAPGLVLAAVPPREDPSDALCARDGHTLANLPAGAVVGTGSPRRAAQLLRHRPDLHVQAVRGNVDSRLRMVSDGRLDAVVLATAGLVRLGRTAAITEYFSPGHHVARSRAGRAGSRMPRGRLRHRLVLRPGPGRRQPADPGRRDGGTQHACDVGGRLHRAGRRGGVRHRRGADPDRGGDRRRRVGDRGRRSAPARVRTQQTSAGSWPWICCPGARRSCSERHDERHRRRPWSFARSAGAGAAYPGPRR